MHTRTVITNRIPHMVGMPHLRWSSAGNETRRAIGTHPPSSMDGGNITSPRNRVDQPNLSRGPHDGTAPTARNAVGPMPPDEADRGRGDAARRRSDVDGYGQHR